MNTTFFLSPTRAFYFTIAVLVSLFSQVYSQVDNFEPQVGQDGKDVVWVPTPQELVDKMLDMAKVTKDAGNRI